MSALAEPADYEALAEARLQQLEAERNAAIVAMVERWPCCKDATEAAGYLLVCQQHREWVNQKWLIHGIKAGKNIDD